MRFKSYETLESSSFPQDPITSTVPNEPPTLDKPLELVFFLPKGVLKKLTHNSNV